MSNTTWDRIILTAPELSTLTTNQKSIILEDVINLVSSAFGDMQEMAQRYLAAHMGTVFLSTTKESSGPVQSESAGDASVSYGQLSIKDINRYDTTSYGRQYLAIRNASILGFRVTK